MKHKRDSSIHKKFLCQQAFDRQVQLIIRAASASSAAAASSSSAGSGPGSGSGFGPVAETVSGLVSLEAIQEALQRKRERDNAVIDVHDAAHNSTVREYEAVTTSATTPTPTATVITNSTGANDATTGSAGEMDISDSGTAAQDSGGALKKRRV